MNVDENILKKWDDLAKSVGVNRTSMIHNAVQVYELFIENQLNGDQKESILEQLEQIKILIEGLEYRELQLNKEQKEIEKEFKSIDIDNLEDFNIISEKILKLLENWGALPYETIATHLGYPLWIIWTVLKKLKQKKKVKVERGEWSLYVK
ncbi:MAG: hypothetical protein ACFFDF_12060 [Candidatus Odinarchaeota archaeon]